MTTNYRIVLGIRWSFAVRPLLAFVGGEMGFVGVVEASGIARVGEVVTGDGMRGEQI